MAPNHELQEAANRGRDVIDRMGYEKTAQKLCDDINKYKNPGVAWAECQGATQELVRLKLLPDTTIEYQNTNGPTNYHVEGVSGDHRDLLIATGDGPTKHYVTMDSNGVFYNAVLDRQHSAPGQPSFLRGQEYAANAKELDKKDGTCFVPAYHSSVIRDSNNLPVEVKDAYGRGWKVQREPDGTPGDIVSSAADGRFAAFSKNSDGTYTENGKRVMVNVGDDGTLSITGLKNVEPDGHAPHYIAVRNDKFTPRGIESGTYQVNGNAIHWQRYGDVTISGNHGKHSYSLAQYDNNQLPEYKSKDANDPNLYRMNWKLGTMVPVK